MATKTNILNGNKKHTTVEHGDIVTCKSADLQTSYVFMAIPTPENRSMLMFICLSNGYDDESFVRYYDKQIFCNGEHVDRIKTLNEMEHFTVYKNSKISIELED